MMAYAPTLSTNTPTSHAITALMLALTAGLFLAACGDDPVSPGEEPTDEFIIEGQLDDYDLGEQSVTPSNSPSLGEGTLNADGSFAVTLFDEEDIEDELEAVDPDGSLFDSFAGFICREEADAELDADARFAIAPALTFAADVDDDDSHEVATLGLASEEVSVVLPVPNPAAGDYHVRWFFANQPVTLDTQCRDGERSVDLELNPGWNEVVYDLSDSDLVRQYTGDRPAEVDWKLDI